MRVSTSLRTALIALTLISSGAAAAVAQPVPPPGFNPYAYERWEDSWDRYEYDRHHVILATVTGFEPYRLQIQRRDGVPQTIDLKNGTVIRPLGATPQPGQRVAVIGYYSQGTFIANRLVLHY